MRYVLPTILTILLSGKTLAATLYLSTTGLTYHAIPVNEELAQQMPYRLTDNGRWVLHPRETGINLFLPHSLHLTFISLHDCFDEEAQVYGVGNHWALNERVGVGYLAVLYSRKRHYFIDSDGARAYAADMPYTMTDGEHEYIPTAFATYSYQILNGKRWHLTFLFAGNVWLNHMMLSLGQSL